MKKLLLLLLCVPLIGLAQTTTTVRFIKAEVIKEAEERNTEDDREEFGLDNREMGDGIMKLIFEEYECYPECESIGNLILYNYFSYYSTFQYTFFFREDLIIKSKYNEEYLFEIIYDEDKFIGIVY